MPKLDVKDVKLGFWIGLGLFLFTLVAGLVTRVWSSALGSRDGS